MDRQQFNQVNNIHFIGVGGIGMSALAQLCYRIGKDVAGSDLAGGERVEFLRNEGVMVYPEGHDKNYVGAEIDLVVPSLAIPQTNPELRNAVDRGIPIIPYPEMLGYFTRWYRTIAIAGTHGKTTTTAMIAKVLIEGGMDPTVILGSTADFLPGGNFRYGESDWLVIEACEYFSGFLNYSPEIAVITNIEHDHFDAYPEEIDYYNAFKQFAKQANRDYPVVLNVDYPLAKQLHKELIAEDWRVLSYGETDGVERLVDDLPYEVGVPGQHNRINALAVEAVVELLQLDETFLRDALAGFKGTGRRFEKRGKVNQAQVYSDYAHHPTEIVATLSAFRERYPSESIAVLYQAHQHNRTGRLLAEFGPAFLEADSVVVAPVYAARDSQTDKDEFTGEVLAREIAKHQDGVHAFAEWSDLQAEYKKLTENFDVVVVMGAGDTDSRLFG